MPKSDRWLLLGGCSCWVYPGTLESVDLVYDWLKDRYLEDKKAKRKQRVFNYLTIAKGVNLSPHTVRNIVWKMAFKRSKQHVRIVAGVVGGKGENKLSEFVKLLSKDL